MSGGIALTYIGQLITKLRPGHGATTPPPVIPPPAPMGDWHSDDFDSNDWDT